jgi:hypothetical protein
MADDSTTKHAIQERLDIVKMMSTVTAWLAWDTESSRRGTVRNVRDQLRRTTEEKTGTVKGKLSAPPKLGRAELCVVKRSESAVDPRLEKKY